MPLSEDERTRIMGLGEEPPCKPDHPSVSESELVDSPVFPSTDNTADTEVDPLDGWESPTTIQRPVAVPSPAPGEKSTPTEAPGSTAPQPPLRRRAAAAPSPYVTDPDYRTESSPSPSPDAVRSPAPRAPHLHKPARHGCLSALLWLVMLVVASFIAIRCIPSEYANGRLVPELASFVPLMLAPAAVCAVLALLWRRRVLAVVSLLALGLIGWWHAGYLIPGATVSDVARGAVATADANDSAARIMTLNTRNGQASAADIVSLVRSQHVEVLCLQELSNDMVNALDQAGIGELLPYHVISDGASSVSNGGRNGIWSLAPMGNILTNLLPIETSSMPAASITVGGTTVRIVSVHPNSPVRGAQGLWDSGLSVIGSLSDYDHSYLIMGDFNSTWDHARFRELLGSSFVDAGQTAGEGFHMTYPSGGALPSLIEIDHIVYSKDAGLVVSDLATATVSGTDHKALLGTLEVQ